MYIYGNTKSCKTHSLWRANWSYTRMNNTKSRETRNRSLISALRQIRNSPECLIHAIAVSFYWFTYSFLRNALTAKFIWSRNAPKEVDPITISTLHPLQQSFQSLVRDVGHFCIFFRSLFRFGEGWWCWKHVLRRSNTRFTGSTLSHLTLYQSALGILHAASIFPFMGSVNKCINIVEEKL